MHAGRLAAGIGGCLAEEDNPVRLVIRPDQSSLDPHGARPLAKFGKGRTDCRPFRRVNGVQQVAIKIAREVGIETEVAGHLRADHRISPLAKFHSQAPISPASSAARTSKPASLSSRIVSAVLGPVANLPHPHRLEAPSRAHRVATSAAAKPAP